MDRPGRDRIHQRKPWNLNIWVALCRFDIKHVSGMGGRSPPRGGIDPNSGNQQFVLASSEDEEGGEGADEPGPALTKKQAERQKVGDTSLDFRSINEFLLPSWPFPGK